MRTTSIEDNFNKVPLLTLLKIISIQCIYINICLVHVIVIEFYINYFSVINICYHEQQLRWDLVGLTAYRYIVFLYIMETTRLCPYILEPTRLCPHNLYPDTFVPIHVCAHTRLCQHTFVPTHVCAHTRL